MENPSQSYRASPAMWDHNVTRYQWMSRAKKAAKQADI